MSGRTEIMGIPVDRIGLAKVIEDIERCCRSGTPLHIATVNLNFITLARRHPQFRRALLQASICVPDGRIVCWLAALAGEPVAEQITGHDLVRVGLELARECGLRVVLLGGAPGVAEGLATSLRFRHPGLQVSGLEGGRFSLTGETDRHAEVIAHVQAVAPHLLLVALGAPKAEVWLSRHLVDSGAVVGIGVGGVFDTLMGRLPRAPRWMQVAGLESLFQLFVAPRRYARRYLLEDPPTLGVAIASACWRRLVRPGPYQD